MKVLLFLILLGVLLFIVRRLTRSDVRNNEPPVSTAGSMDVSQARAVLGLENTPLERESIIAAHRRLMQRIHPDKGGSALLAQQLNEAKRILLANL